MIKLDISVENDFKPYRQGAFTKRLQTFTDLYVKCGFYGKNAEKLTSHSSGKHKYKLGQLAVLNEFGGSYRTKKAISFPNPNKPGDFIHIKANTLIKIPARRAMRKVLIVKKYRNKIINEAKKQISNLFVSGEKTTPYKVWRAIAKVAKEVTQESYTSGEFLQNSELTQYLKGHNHPLFDKGTLAYNVESGVFRGSETSLKRLLQKQAGGN